MKVTLNYSIMVHSVEVQLQEQQGYTTIFYDLRLLLQRQLKLIMDYYVEIKTSIMLRNFDKSFLVKPLS